jgi:L-alanine-DL-glutamate epimerase-like enolase superfamily enzyme
MNGEVTKATVEHQLQPLLVGMDALDLEACWEKMYVTTYKTRGQGTSIAISGVDIALHDLMGKALGVPLYRLLGGRYRERVPLTWNVPATRDIDLMVRQAGDAVARGFRNVVKVKTGTPWDVDALAAIQQAIGPDVPLRPDDNGAFLAGDSIRRFGAARDRGVVYECLEQPAPNDDLPGLRRVGDALGERVMYHVGYVRQSVAYEIIRSRACDVVSVPVFRHGLRQTSQLVRAFELAGIGCAMGSGLESSIAATAAIHAATALENFAYPIDTLGAHWFAEDVLRDTSHFGAGYAVAPDGPGLGIELDWAPPERLSARAPHASLPAGYLPRPNWSRMPFSSWPRPSSASRAVTVASAPRNLPSQRPTAPSSSEVAPCRQKRHSA